MYRRLIAAAVGAGITALPAIAAAPQTAQPGQMTQAHVWVENRSRSEAVSVDLSSISIDRPIKVHVSNGDPAEGESPLATRAARQAWDYDSVALAAGANAAETLNARGAAGWEAVGVVNGAAGAATILLKRPR